MTIVKKRTPETCSRCGSYLFPPHLAPDLEIRVAADFVCANCGRAYLWRGKPRRLSVVLPSAQSDEDEADDEGCLCRLALSAPAPEDRPLGWTALPQKPRKNLRLVWHCP